MNKKFNIFISISAVSVFSFLAIAKHTPGHKPAGYDRRAEVPQNVRAEGGLTLFEQYAQNHDLAITARIREGIDARNHLSVNARNVEITTTGGKVVLKGAVTTAEEKRLIGDIANGVQRREKVENQLVVRQSPTAPTAPTALRVVQ